MKFAGDGTTTPQEILVVFFDERKKKSGRAREWAMDEYNKHYNINIARCMYSCNRENGRENFGKHNDGWNMDDGFGSDVLWKHCCLWGCKFN